MAKSAFKPLDFRSLFHSRPSIPREAQDGRLELVLELRIVEILLALSDGYPPRSSRYWFWSLYWYWCWPKGT